jgi:N-methylhydantoinase B/oxoprolinase/acetone carboxylase alpha subunit
VTTTKGSRNIVKGAAVAPDRVLQAARELGDSGVLAAVEEALAAAREAAERKIAELQQQLAEAKALLDSLG